MFPFKPEEKQLCVDRPSKTNPRGLTKEQLMDYARRMGISAAGNKTDLCDRIFAHIAHPAAVAPVAPVAAVAAVGHKLPNPKAPKVPKEDSFAKLMASMPAIPDKPVGLTPELEKLWKTDPAFVKMIMAAPLPPSRAPPLILTVKRVVASLTAKQVKQMAIELLGLLSNKDPIAGRLIIMIAGNVTKEDSDFVLSESRRRATNPRLVTYAALPKQLKQTGGGKNRR